MLPFAAMIKLTVREAARKRGIKTAYRLSQALGDGKDRTRGLRLWRGVLVSLQTLDDVAEALGNCDLSELVTRVPNKRRKEPPVRQRGAKKAASKSKG